jgi:hypothetical protein
MTYQDLYDRLHDEPFKPFRIRTSTSSVYDILEPWMILVGESAAVIAYQTRLDEDGLTVPTRFRTVSIAHMVELEDIEPTKKDRRRRAS